VNPLCKASASCSRRRNTRFHRAYAACADVRKSREVALEGPWRFGAASQRQPRAMPCRHRRRRNPCRGYRPIIQTSPVEVSAFNANPDPAQRIRDDPPNAGSTPLQRHGQEMIAAVELPQRGTAPLGGESGRPCRCLHQAGVGRSKQTFDHA